MGEREGKPKWGANPFPLARQFYFSLVISKFMAPVGNMGKLLEGGHGQADGMCMTSRQEKLRMVLHSFFLPRCQAHMLWRCRKIETPWITDLLCGQLPESLSNSPWTLWEWEISTALLGEVWGIVCYCNKSDLSCLIQSTLNLFHPPQFLGYSHLALQLSSIGWLMPVADGGSPGWSGLGHQVDTTKPRSLEGTLTLFVSS